jgi:hypothetical protein
MKRNLIKHWTLLREIPSLAFIEVLRILIRWYRWPTAWCLWLFLCFPVLILDDG